MTRDLIMEYFSTSPQPSVQEAVALTGVSRQRVYQIIKELKAEGLAIEVYPAAAPVSIEQPSLEEQRKAHIEAYRKKQKLAEDMRLCHNCVTNKPSPFGGVYCEDCKKKKNEYQRGRYQKRKEVGNCVKCGETMETEASYCEDCIKKARQWQKAS